MILYRKMTVKEFADYREYSNKFRGKELSIAYGHSTCEGLRLANDELNGCLPSGLDTVDHHLMCIEMVGSEGATVIGYLWYGLSSGDRSAFVYDFQIFFEYRGKGYGSIVFNLLEETLNSNGVEQVELLVAYENERAVKLYKELGFQATGINMVKRTKN